MSQRKGLTLRQKRFVAEYLADYNATRAAIRAGYSAANADKIGSQLLRKPAVVEAINEHHQTIVARAKVSSANLIRELQLIAFSDVADYEVDERGHLRTVKHIDAGRRRAVKSFKCRTRVVSVERDGDVTTTTTESEVEVVLHDKLRALQMLATHQGLLNRPKDADPLKELLQALPEYIRDALRAELLNNSTSGQLPTAFAIEPPAATFDKPGGIVVVPVDGPAVQEAGDGSTGGH